MKVLRFLVFAMAIINVLFAGCVLYLTLIAEVSRALGITVVIIHSLLGAHCFWTVNNERH